MTTMTHDEDIQHKEKVYRGRESA